MFNKKDGLAGGWGPCCQAVARIDRDPRDYFLGLPDAPPVMPRDILLFSRQAPFDYGHGSEHHRFLLIVALKGEGDVLLDDQVAHLRPGAAMVVTPHQFHHYARFKGSQLLWLFMTFELDDMTALDSLRGRVLKMTPLQVTSVRYLADRYAALGGRRESDPRITLLAALLLQEFLGDVPRGEAVPLADISSSRRLMQEVARYVHGHVATPIRIRHVARAVGLSESHLRARFNELAGIGLGAYIRRLRLHRARKMVRGSALRLKEIAEQCGYDSIYSFSRTFRHETGMSPSLYRRQHSAAGRKLFKD